MGFKFKGTSKVYDALNSANKPKLRLGSSSPTIRKRNPAKVKITGKSMRDGNTLDSYTLPENVGTVPTIENLYGASSRPKPGLKNIQVDVTGEYGMLLRASVSYIVYTIEDFNRLESIFMRPNNLVDIDIEYPNRSTWDAKFLDDIDTSEFKRLICKDMVIYKFEFKTQDNFAIECKFDCMAQSSTISEGFDMFVDINPETLPAVTNLKIKRGANEQESTVNGIIDIIYHNLFSNNVSVRRGFTANETYVYPVAQAWKAGLPENAAHNLVLYTKLPSKGLLATRRLSRLQRFFTNRENSAIYITLGYLVNVLLNQVIIPANIEQLNTELELARTSTNAVTPEEIRNIQSNISSSRIEFICNNDYLRAPDYTFLPSGDPMRVVWVHGSDAENSPDPLVKFANYSGTSQEVETIIISTMVDGVTFERGGLEYIRKDNNWYVKVNPYVGTDGNTYDLMIVQQSAQNTITREYVQYVTGTHHHSFEVEGYNFFVKTDHDQAGVYYDRLQFNKLKNRNESGFVDLTKILINIDEIVRIFEEIRERDESKSNAERMSNEDTPAVKLTIKSFLNKIFAMIRDASGGLYDIGIINWDQEDNDDTNKLLLINKKFNLPKNDNPIYPVIFNDIAADGVTRMSSVTMQIPKDMVAMNAYADGHMEGTTAATINARGDTTPEDQYEAQVVRHQKATKNLLIKRIYAFSGDKFGESGTDALKSAVRQFINTIPKDVIRHDTVVPYPLSIELRVDGINGFEFGDILSLNSITQLNNNYKDVVFRVLNVSHTVDENNDWVTNIKTVCDLNPYGSNVQRYSDIPVAAIGSSYYVSGDNANALRQALDTWEYTEKGRELDEAGDISTTMLRYALDVFSRISDKYSDSGYRFELTSGNDAEHYIISRNNNYTSRHTLGNAIDFKFTNPTIPNRFDRDNTDLNNIVEILEEIRAGSNGQFAYRDEYRDPSEPARGPHFHISVA